MQASPRSYSRSFWIGLAGFILGGIISALATYIIFASGIMSLILKLVPADQSLVRLVLGIVLAFVGIGLGGAVGGLVRGHSLHLIDLQGSQKRYLLGGAYSTWISQGILVVPIMLLISLISLYNNGSQRDPASYIVFFTLVGFLFGLLNGATLSLITLRLRYAWIAWLGYLLASLVGGALFGVLVWRWEWISSPVPQGLVTLLFLILAGVTIYGIPGGAIGMIYSWLSRKRSVEQLQAITPRRWQDIMTITVFTVLFLFVASFVNSATDFVTKTQGSVTTNLSNPTEGVHWQESHVISTDVSAQDGTTLGLAAGPQAMVTTWSNDSGEILLAFRQSVEDGLTIWNGPITVSNSLQNASVHPQVALGLDGQAHVIWSEDGEIWYNRCQNSECEEPFSLTRGEQDCTTGSTQAQNDWPTLAIAEDGTLMAAWQAGEFAAGYATWEATLGPESRVTGCITSDLASPRPRLSVGKPGEFWMVLSGAQDAPENVSLVRFGQGEWDIPQVVGAGSSAEVFTNQDGNIYSAWCGANNELYYLPASNPVELVPSATCRNRPSIFEDTSGRTHLVYATDQWQDNFGTTRNGNALMETIRLSTGWSEPALVGPLFSDVQQEAAGAMGSDIQLAWVDTQAGSLALRHSIQPVYQCDEGSLSGPMKIVLDMVQNGEFHPADYQSPFCGNQFKGFVFMPNPDPEFYVLPPGERTGYDQLADIIMTSTV